MSALAVTLFSLLAIGPGQNVGICGWPSTLQVLTPAQEGCSGVLVHPQVVVLDDLCYDLAAGQPLTFDFGSVGVVADLSVNVPASACTFGENTGFCVLGSPLNIPYAPILAGCELSQLQVGSQLAITGFGATSEMAGDFDMHRGDVTVTLLNGTSIFVEGTDAPCAGDGGGPAMLQMADGSWRTVGIATTTDCNSPSTYAGISHLIEWIESESGFDITPCFDDLGLPNLVDIDCGGFYSGGNGGVGTWANQCAGAPTVDTGACIDKLPPAVSIASPMNEEQFDGAITLDVEINADDGVGLGIYDVRLELEGQILDFELTEPPFSFELAFPVGEWNLRAIARDWGGNEVMSDPVVIYVGVDPPAGSTGGDSGSSSGGDESTGDALDDTGDSGSTTGGGDDGPAEDDADEPPAPITGGAEEPFAAAPETGCQCGAGGAGGGGAWWLFAVVAFGLRRRVWR